MQPDRVDNSPLTYIRGIALLQSFSIEVYIGSCRGAPMQILQAAHASPEQRIDHTALMAGFFGIARLWGLSNAEARILLGQPAERTFFKWKKGDVASLPLDVLHRIGLVAGIYKALQILYSDPALADRWLRAPNSAFGGQKPLARMYAGQITDLEAVRAYLDAARGPWS